MVYATAFYAPNYAGLNEPLRHHLTSLSSCSIGLTHLVVHLDLSFAVLDRVLDQLQLRRQLILLVTEEHRRRVCLVQRWRRESAEAGDVQAGDLHLEQVQAEPHAFRFGDQT